MTARRASAIDILFRKFSLQARVAILLAIAILPVGTVSIWQAMVAANETTRLEQDVLIDRTRRAAEDERVIVTAALGALGGLAVLAPMTEASVQECSGVLRRFVNTDPKFVLAAYVEADGTVMCASDAVFAGASYQSLVAQWEPLLTSERQSAISLGNPWREDTLLSLAKPIYRDGRRVGTLLVAIPVTLMNTITRADDDPDFRLAIVDWQGQKASEDAPLTQDPQWWPLDLAVPAAEILTEHVILQQSVAGRRRAYAIVPILPGETFAIGSWRHDELMQNASRRKLQALLFPATMWMLALGVSYFAVHRLAVRHIEYLRRLIRAFESGRRSVRAQQLLTASPEISELGHAFNRMASTIERDEAELERSVEEKNTLLREVHHRVKNNLQLVISMMNIQLRDAPNDHAREAITQTQNRVMSLATVHQRLYQAGNLAAVRCDDLISEIVRNLVDADPRAKGISVDSDLIPLEMDPDRAIPLSLIATESIINALKYGIDSPDARLTVRMTEMQDGQICLEIRNPAIDPQIRETAGTGLRLKQAFASQLGGSIERAVEGGVYRISLTFPKPRED